MTYERQLGNYHPQSGQEVDSEVGQIEMGVVSAEEEEHDRYAEQELLSRCILVAVVDLLPHVEIVIGTGIKFERNAPHPVEHEERSEHVADVGKGPRSFLRDARDDVVENLESGDADEMNGPGTYKYHEIPR